MPYFSYHVSTHPVHHSRKMNRKKKRKIGKIIKNRFSLKWTFLLRQGVEDEKAYETHHDQAEAEGEKEFVTKCYYSAHWSSPRILFCKFLIPNAKSMSLLGCELRRDLGN